MDQVDHAVRVCPLCREEIRADAVRCKHCQGWVGVETAGHGGVCPFCREQIHPEAIRCKHCRADLVLGRGGGRQAERVARADDGGCGCGGGSGSGGRRTRRRMRTGPEAGFRFDRSADAAPGISTGPTAPGTSCPWWVDDHGWFGVLVEWDDVSCTYEEY